MPDMGLYVRVSAMYSLRVLLFIAIIGDKSDFYGQNSHRATFNH